tara:strand:+ start:426 stop:581 length:156 start_codon:yes stop_codon:yes gene_type:complete
MKNFNIKSWLQKLPKHFTITKLEKKQNQIIIKITIENELKTRSMRLHKVTS